MIWRRMTKITFPTYGMLTTIPNTIRDVLQHERWYMYMSIDARKLLVPLTNVPSEYLASSLK